MIKMNLHFAIKKHFLFLAILLIVSAYLGLKALPEDSWDDWAFGSAQTMMTMKYWRENGIIASKFFFTPVGYSKAALHIDEPEMRHHARGSTTGGLIGNRFYYTHYPSGYLLPHGLLEKIGLESRFGHRMMALFFSLAGIIFMYALFNIITTKTVSLIAVIYYIGSVMFLGLSDSLANMPMDDFLRFLIMFLSAYSAFKISDGGLEKRLSFLIWFLYFILALSSYDSTFFIFVWLIGLDVITKKKFLWRKWLLYASAPFLAFSLQMLQNVWYLGVKDAWMDFYGSFKFRTSHAPGSMFLEKNIRAVFSPLVYMTSARARFAIIVTGFLFAAFVFLRNRFSYKWPDFKIIVLLFLSAASYPFILVSSGYFPYQGRQMAPFVAILLSSATVSVYFIIKKSIQTKNYKTQNIAVVFFLVCLTGFFWFLQFNRTYDYVKNWPNNKVDQKIINFASDIKKAADGKDAMVFMMSSLSEHRYPQPEQTFEYYVGLPILSFKNSEDLINDLEWLKNRSETYFLPIVVLENPEQTKYFTNLSDKKAILITQNEK